VISFAEIRYSVVGALRLARGDAGGLAHFDDSVERFWRSFWAAAVCAPFYFLMIVSIVREKPIDDWTHATFSAAVTYTIGWALWPLAMIYVADWVQRGHRYFRYMQAYNWAQVAGALLQTLVVLIGIGMGAKGQQALLQLVTLVVLIYEWYVARVALEVSGLQAVGIVALNMVLVYVVIGGAEALTRL